MGENLSGVIILLFKIWEKFTSSLQIKENKTETKQPTDIKLTLQRGMGFGALALSRLLGS